MKNNLSFYESVYYNIINNKLEENNKILFIIDNYFNPFDFFNYIIKKYNIYIYIVIDNIDIFNKLIENINGEECYKNVTINLKLSQINDISFDKIIIGHIHSIEYLNELLKLILKLCNKNSLLYIYSSLSNEKITKINYKNYIRNQIMSFLPYKMGSLISFSDFTKEIENNKEYNIDSMKIYKKNNYLIYGDNIVYETILRL